MTLRNLLVLFFTLSVTSAVFSEEKTKTENFDSDPGWEGVNNRSAKTAQPKTVKEDFGYSRTNKAGGARAGEIGGYLSQAGEISYYAKPIVSKSFDTPLSASGTFACEDGAYHLLLGFFNSDTAHEWRGANTLAIRLQGRGDFFFAYTEYCTSKWRAGGDSTPFPSRKDPQSGRMSQIGFPSKGQSHKWSLTYDPKGNDGNGEITATIDGNTSICKISSEHRADGATFNRFGILAVMKSADSGANVYFDDVTLNGKTDSFDIDPMWEGKNNRKTWTSTLIRPLFDFGYSPTQFAGGKSSGELGGQTFRGDCRYPDRMGCYGDKLGPLTLDKPIKASGKIAMTRGVTDSSTLFGFYNSKDSMRSNPGQNVMIPENTLGISVEGPSSEGFLFYPVCQTKSGGASGGRSSPHILPNGDPHEWSLAYDPNGADGKGQITVAFDGESRTVDLPQGIKASGATFDRFGMLTTWIDGNSQNVYLDDITYTVAQ